MCRHVTNLESQLEHEEKKCNECIQPSLYKAHCLVRLVRQLRIKLYYKNYHLNLHIFSSKQKAERIKFEKLRKNSKRNAHIIETRVESAFIILILMNDKNNRTHHKYVIN